MEELIEDGLEEIRKELWSQHRYLQGLGGLFVLGARDGCLNDTEFYGVGLMIKRISENLETLEDDLQSCKELLAENLVRLANADESEHIGGADFTR